MQAFRHFGKKTLPWFGGAAVFVLLAATAVFWRPARARLVGLFKPPAASPAAPSEPRAGERKILYYEDPMHPWYRSDKPGIAPDCGMKLVPVYADEGATLAATPPGTVQIDPARQQLMGITTARAEYRTLEKSIRTVGYVAIDETRLTNIHVKTSGWIQKVFADYTWQYVKKGEPLFTLYSPDLLATEQEYLLALKAQRSLGASSFREVAAGGDSLLEAARRRLSLWDLTDEQIRQLEETGEPHRETTFYAPVSGFVMERRAFPNQYVSPETEIYRLADLSTVWVQADIYEFELANVSLGQAATLTTDSLAGRKFRGRLVYLYPEVKPETRTVMARMEFPNPGLKLKPGMFVNVELRRVLRRQLTVPIDAVLDSGARQIVFVDLGTGAFEPREVKLGERTETLAAIMSGLRAGEKVVTRANFLIDSESNLRQAVAAMAGMQHEGHAPEKPQTLSQPPSPPASEHEQHRH